MKRFIFYSLILFSIILSSCARRGRHSFSEIKRIETRLGMSITPKDNYYLYRESSLWIGTPYRYGGCSIRGIDCSCFVMQIYNSVYQRKLQRSTQLIYDNDCRRISLRALKEGDLVFFGNKRSRKVNHVGVYLKHGYFVHASTSRGVMVSSLDEPYFKQRFVSGGRIK